MRRELRNVKTGQHENKQQTAEGEMTAQERITHERTGHAMHDPRCVTCLNVRGVTTHPRRAVAHAAYLSLCSRQEQSARCRSRDSGRSRSVENRLQEPFIEFEDLEQFLKVLHTRYGNIPLYCDQKECLREVVYSRAVKLCLPTGVTAVEQKKQMDVRNNEFEH